MLSLSLFKRGQGGAWRWYFSLPPPPLPHSQTNTSVRTYQCWPDVTDFFFFFCMCLLTAGKNISSNYSPQAHSFCLSPDKGIWNPGCQRGMLKTVEWISLGRGNISWRTLNQLGMVMTRMHIQRHPLQLALHGFGNCFKPRMFSWNNCEVFIVISNSKRRNSFCFGHVSLKKNLRCGYRWEIEWADGR